MLRCLCAHLLRCRVSTLSDRLPGPVCMLAQISTLHSFRPVCASWAILPRIKILEKRPCHFPRGPPADLSSLASGLGSAHPRRVVPSTLRGSLGRQRLTSGCLRPGRKSSILTWRRPLGPPDHAAEDRQQPVCQGLPGHRERQAGEKVRGAREGRGRVLEGAGRGGGYPPL